jgi:hypothetical protein
MLLQEHEREAYNRLTLQLTEDLNPQTELEHQLVQKIIDCHTRLNRIAAIDANLLNVEIASIQWNDDIPESTALATICSQTQSWSKHADHFDKLGRYEARISRQLLQYTKELERLQAERKQTQPTESQATSPKLASFRSTPPELINSRHASDRNSAIISDDDTGGGAGSPSKPGDLAA